MFLPIRLTWNLQMSRAHKIGIFILFGSGFVCIAFATLRVIQLGIDGRGKTTTPEPKWMLLWTVLECSMGTHHPLILLPNHPLKSFTSDNHWLFTCVRSPDP
jgi:hypothetical protein